jgi:hypothetical protein
MFTLDVLPLAQVRLAAPFQADRQLDQRLAKEPLRNAYTPLRKGMPSRQRFLTKNDIKTTDWLASRSLGFVRLNVCTNSDFLILAKRTILRKGASTYETDDLEVRPFLARVSSVVSDTCVFKCLQSFQVLPRHQHCQTILKDRRALRERRGSPDVKTLEASTTRRGRFQVRDQVWKKIRT